CYGIVQVRTSVWVALSTSRLFLLLNLVVILLFLPWLPTAITRVQSWPKGGAALEWRMGFILTLRTLLLGPIQDGPVPVWPWLGGALLLSLFGCWQMWRQAR